MSKHILGLQREPKREECRQDIIAAWQAMSQVRYMRVRGTNSDETFGRTYINLVVCMPPSSVRISPPWGCSFQLSSPTCFWLLNQGLSPPHYSLLRSPGGIRLVQSVLLPSTQNISFLGCAWIVRPLYLHTWFVCEWMLFAASTLAFRHHHLRIAGQLRRNQCPRIWWMWLLCAFVFSTLWACWLFCEYI